MKIDGSFGEGGGAILRVVAGLACSTKTPIQIFNIRANRSKPGLRLQHVVGLQALAELTQGELSKLNEDGKIIDGTIDVGTTALSFSSGSTWKEEITIITRTAGNIGLICQTLQNALFNAPPSQYHFKFQGGGTYGIFAPGIEYIRNVTFKIFEQCGYNFNLQIEKHGFYPKGGAQVELIVTPNAKKYKPLILEERSDLEKIHICITVEERIKKKNVGARIQKVVENNLQKYNEFLDFEINYVSCLSVGVAIDAWCNYSNSVVIGMETTLGEKRKTSEQVGRIISEKLKDLLSGEFTLDSYAADQVIPFLLMYGQKFKIIVPEITSHLKTNIEIMANFFNIGPKIEEKNPRFFIISNF